MEQHFLNEWVLHQVLCMVIVERRRGIDELTNQRIKKGAFARTNITDYADEFSLLDWNTNIFQRQEGIKCLDFWLEQFFFRLGSFTTFWIFGVFFSTFALWIFLALLFLFLSLTTPVEVRSRVEDDRLVSLFIVDLFYQWWIDLVYQDKFLNPGHRDLEL